MNSDTAIQIRGIGKRYRIGVADKPSYNRIGDAVKRMTRQPLKALRGGGPMNETNSFWALKDINFDVSHGEVVGIIGRNGAGKSTLLKVLSRITMPTEGEVLLRGRVGSLLEVGTGFHPELTGRENVYMNGSILGMTQSEIRSKFEEIVDFSEIEKFIDTPVKQYSSGMYTRLAFSVAAHLDPEILIVDEVLAVGDAAFQKKCLGKMKDVAGQGRTVLFVSHNMSAVQRLCSRCVELAGGRVVAEGASADVVQDYLVRSEDEDDVVRVADRDDRKGDGSVRLQDIWLESEDGRRQGASVCGQPVRICMSYRVESKIDSLNFAMGVYNPDGLSITHFNTKLRPLEGKPSEGVGVVACQVDRMPLSPGTYWLNVACSRRGGLADHLERAAKLTVTEADFFGAGFLPDLQQARVYIDHSWATDDRVLDAGGTPA
ncbi:MAG: ABC transporter ATP-binding protein [Planctomycetota bacterium]